MARRLRTILLASAGVGTPQWSAYDDGYLQAYQWSFALAGGAALPQADAPLQLGPGEQAHLHLAPVTVVGYYGENKGYRRSFVLFGGPVGLAVTGAASLAHNASKKAEAKRAAVPHWHTLGTADLVVTNQRIALTVGGKIESVWYAETSPLQITAGAGGVPAVGLQPSDMPPLRLESPWAPLVYVFVHYLVDGQAPGVPVPEGLLERARAEGRLNA